MGRETREAILSVDLGSHTSERLSSRAWQVLSVPRVQARFVVTSAPSSSVAPGR